MKIFTDWGFTREGWLNNSRGEYWVVAQGVSIALFVLLPVYRPTWLVFPNSNWLYVSWGIATAIALAALVFSLKGLLDLGQQLTPLPYPKAEGKLVQTGVYSLVRHPLYSGVILGSLSWAIFQLSLSHLIGVIFLFILLNTKASREEVWLTEKYADYSNYQQQTKKLIPWLY